MANEELKFLEKYKDFFQDLNAEKIMNRVLIFLKEDNIIKEAQDIMKIKKISGVPIVDNGHRLINIISTEDIIKALETGKINKKIKELEKKNIITLKENDGFEKIVEYIATYGYGRYPVLNSENKLSGIITKQDILYAVVGKLSILYLHDERRREVLDSPLSILLKNKIDENKPEFTYEVDVDDVNKAGEGSALLKEYLVANKFDKSLVRKISISTYEAEVNVVIHGGGKGKIIATVDDESIVIFVEDSGPGIENIDQVMQPGFSTAPEYIRSLGFGAGMGLPNIKRFADKLIITSEKNRGTKVEMVFWKNLV
jgi:CBS domain-containing protein